MKKARLKQLRAYLNEIIPEEKRKIDSDKTIKELISDKNKKEKTKRKAKTK